MGWRRNKIPEWGSSTLLWKPLDKLFLYSLGSDELGAEELTQAPGKGHFGSGPAFGVLPFAVRWSRESPRGAVYPSSWPCLPSPGTVVNLVPPWLENKRNQLCHFADWTLWLKLEQAGLFLWHRLSFFVAVITNWRWRNMALPHMVILHPPATGHWVTSWPHWFWVAFWHLACGEGTWAASCGGLSYAGWVYRQRTWRARLQRTSSELFRSRPGTPESSALAPQPQDPLQDTLWSL